MNWRSVAMILWTLVWTLVGLTVLAIDWSGRLYMTLARIGWAPQVLGLAGVKLSVIGVENLEPGRHYIICCNHASQVDIPVIVAALPLNERFLAKRSLFYIPLFGWSMAIARFIPVDRGSSRKSRRSIEVASEKIRKGPSVVIFPEGTRTPDGELKAFKSGAFVMGVKSGVSILPVALRGTFDVVPKSTIKVTPGRVEVIVGKPIVTEGLAMKDKESVRTRCREAIAGMIETGEPV